MMIIYLKSSRKGVLMISFNAITLIEEAQDEATEWLWCYNNKRPHMALGGKTPVQAALAVNAKPVLH